MRTISTLMCAAAVMAAPAALPAQDSPGVELGTALGASIFSSGGQTFTKIGVPGLGVGLASTILGSGSALYATFFPGKLLVQPEFNLSILSGGGSTVTLMGLATHIGLLFSGPDANSAYIAAHPALEFASGGGSSDAEFALGGRVGYRILAGDLFSVRFHGGYRRWFDSEVNEFTIGIAFGAILGRR